MGFNEQERGVGYSTTLISVAPSWNGACSYIRKWNQGPSIVTILRKFNPRNFCRS